jgi:hypothetical protein
MLSKKRKSFSEDARCIRPLLNDTVDLHFKQSTIIEILPVPKSDSIRSILPESGNPRFRRSYSGHNIPARTTGWPDLARKFRPTGRIPAVLADSGQYVGIRQFWLESIHFRWNPANADSSETVRIPAFILNYGYSSRNGEIR